MPEIVNGFSRRGGVLACEDADLSRIAEDYGTPAYVYSANAIRSRFRAYDEALAGVPHRVCYAVKANSNLSVLCLLAREGAGFDIVSGGELFRVLEAGGDASKIVFSGVGKTEPEITYALERGIHSFNCESEAEIEILSRLAARTGHRASIAIRVNPDVDPRTHPYISTGLREHKFGIDIADARALYRQAAALPGIHCEGVSCHIGSQLLSVDPVLEAADKVVSLVADLRSDGHDIRTLDLGGGLGVPYRPSEDAVPISAFTERLRTKIDGLGLTLFVEPGRSIVAEAGILLSRVILIKRNGERTFVVLDAGMNDLIRPALYDAHHEITAVLQREGSMRADIVGPVCETGDFFARDRDIPALRPGDLVAIRTAGAYGFVLGSNYNSRPRPCELLVDRQKVVIARARETYADLIRGESAHNGKGDDDCPVSGARRESA